METVKRASKFLTQSTKPGDIKAAMAASNPERQQIMRDVMRTEVDNTLTSPGNDLTSLYKLMGRGQNARVRENMAAGFGGDATDKMSNLLASEVKKSDDYAQILKGSKTASTLGADEALNEALGVSGMPRNGSIMGVTKELAASAIRKLLALTDRRSGKAREAIAKVSTMSLPELQNLISQLDRAAAMRKGFGNASRAAAISGATGLTNQYQN
jgi:hypothetical protein